MPAAGENGAADDFIAGPGSYQVVRIGGRARSQREEFHKGTAILAPTGDEVSGDVRNRSRGFPLEKHLGAGSEGAQNHGRGTNHGTEADEVGHDREIRRIIPNAKFSKVT